MQLFTSEIGFGMISDADDQLLKTEHKLQFSVNKISFSTKKLCSGCKFDKTKFMKETTMMTYTFSPVSSVLKFIIKYRGTILYY